MSPLLKADKLKKEFLYPKKMMLLDNVNLEVHKGEVVSIVGQSGEGKTTLLHILGTLEDATSGTLSIGGEVVTKLNKSELLNRMIGFVFQGFHLLEDYTVMENILMPAKIGRQATHPASLAYKQALAKLDKVGLLERKDQPAKLLSGGEKQRVAIARALCNNPSLILADEPSGNLDEKNSNIIHSLLINLAKEENKAVVIVTHNPKLASLSDRTLTLRNKQLEL